MLLKGDRRAFLPAVFKHCSGGTIVSWKSFGVLAVVLVVNFGFVEFASGQATFQSNTSSGNWGVSSTWSISSGSDADGIPDANDDVIITSTHNVTVNGIHSCASLQIGNGGNSTAQLNFSGVAPKLTVTGNVNVGQSSGGQNRTGRITFTSDATLIANAIVLYQNITGSIVCAIDMASGGTLETGSFSLGTGSTSPTWTPGAGTVKLTASNTLPSTIFTSFNNLTVSAGTTTFGAATSMMGALSISSGAVVNLGSYTSSAFSLSLGGASQSNGSWGGSGSGATNINTTYFAAATGILNVDNTKLTYTSSGNFIVPAGVTSITVEAWGGGGGGGGTNGSGGRARGGGGGGAYTKGTLTGLTPGSSITVTVGGGGAAGNSTSGNAGDGGNSSVGSIVANGGKGASNSSSNSPGDGGSASSVTGNVVQSFAGGNGGNGNGSSNGGGGGGGSAPSSTLPGQDGSNGSGGTGGNGGNSPLPDPEGNGGRGANNNGNPGAGNGIAPGGGGGGQSDDDEHGGSGAPGQVIISWQIPCTSYTATLSGGATICSGTSTDLTVTMSGGTSDYTVVYTDGLGNTTTVSNYTSGSAISVSPTATSTYTLVSVTDADGCTATTSGTAIVTVHATPSAPTGAASQSFCSGDNPTVADLNATGTSIQWYLFSSGGTPLAGTTALVDGTHYYASQTVAGCESTSRLDVTATVADAPVTTGVTICSGGSGELTSSTTCGGGGSGSDGPNFAGSAVNGGGGGTAWSSLGNISLDDDNAVTATLPASGTSQALYVTNFGFSIPPGASIDGITVTINRWSSWDFLGGIADVVIQLTKNGTTPIGQNKAVTGATWSTSNTTLVSYGAANDLWSTTWTPSEINALTFGVRLDVLNSFGFFDVSANVDYIQITVTYTLPNSVDWYTVSSGGTAIGSGSPFNPVGVSGSGLPDTNTPGTYTFYAACSDAPDCRTATDFVINESPTANAGSPLTAFCQSGASAALGGSVGGSATGGTWDDGGAGGTFSPSATDLNATWTPPANYSGTATLTLTTSGGSCGTAMDSKTQLVNPLPTAGSCNIVPDACYDNMGSVDISASGGTPPYSVSWTPAHGISQPQAIAGSGGTVTITGLHANTNYTFIVTDSNNCQAP